MARMIYQRDSTAMHLRMGRRHIRLCGRVPGADPFATAIRPLLDKLSVKETERLKAEEVREEAYDAVILFDSHLGNAVRTAYERVRQYDRENRTRTLDLLFPDHGFSTIINAPMSEEPKEVNKLLERLAGMEDGHPLKDIDTPLREKMNESISAWAAYQQTIDHLDALRANEENERLAVRQQYEYNWLDARKQYGVSVAESIFPKVRNKPAATNSSDKPKN